MSIADRCLSPPLKPIDTYPLIITLSLLLLFLPVLNHPRPIMGYDFINLDYCLFPFMLTSTWQGVYPLWNPGIFSGYPMMERLFTGLFYLPNNLLLLGAGSGMKLYILLHIILAALGMYYLCRSQKITNSAAAIAAVAFSLSAQIVERIFAGQATSIAIAAYLPWIARYAIAVAAEDNSQSLARLSLLFGVIFSLGHHFGIILSSVIIAYFAVSGYRDYRSLVRVCLAFLFGVCLGAMFWAPALNLSSTAVIDLSFTERALDFSFPFANVIQFLFPAAFGFTFFGSYPSLFPYYGRGILLWEIIPYCGLINFMFGIYALVMVRNAATRRWGIFFLISLVLSFGYYTPVYPFLVHLAPMLKLFYTTGKFLTLTIMGLCVLSGLAIDRLLTSREYSKTTAGYFMCAYMLVAVVFIVTYRGLWPGQLNMMRANLELSEAMLPEALSAFKLFYFKESFPLLVILSITTLLIYLVYRNRISVRVFGLLLLAAVVAEHTVFLYSRIYYTSPHMYTYPSAIVKTLQADTVPFRVATTNQYAIPNQYGFENVQGYFTGILGNYTEFLSRARPGSYQQSFYYSILSDWNFAGAWLNCKYVLSQAPLTDAGLELLMRNNGYYVYTIKSYAPRLWFYPSALLPAVSRVQTFTQALYGVPVDSVDVPLPTPKQGIIHEYLARNANEFSVSVETPSAGLLVFSEISYIGWRAYCDERQVPVLAWNNVFRALAVPAGRHIIRFRYLPFPFVFGIAVSVISFLTLGIYMWIKSKQESSVIGQNWN